MLQAFAVTRRKEAYVIAAHLIVAVVAVICSVEGTVRPGGPREARTISWYIQRAMDMDLDELIGGTASTTAGVPKFDTLMNETTL